MALPDIIVMIKYLVIRHIAKQKKNINCELFLPTINPSSPLFSKTNIFSHKSSDSSPLYSSNKHK